MRKVTKILGKTFAAVVLLLIVLPVLLSLLLDIPAVQNFAVRKAAEAVSRKLETVVSIDRVDIGLFNKIAIYGFYVEDYQRDTMIYAGKVDAYVTGLGLLGGGISLGWGEISDAKLCLHETPEGVMNIKQVVDRLSRPDRERKGGFKLTLHSASLRNFELCLERQQRRNPAYGIDYGHMHLYDVQASVDRLTFDGSSIYADIASFGARERSGFRLDDLSGHFYMDNGCIGFEQARIVTGRSDIRIPSIGLVGDTWADYKYFVDEVQLCGSFAGSKISTDDVACFAPSLRDWHMTFSDVDLEFEGSVSDFMLRIAGLRTGAGTSLAADVAVRGLPDIRSAHFDVRLGGLASVGGDVAALARSVGHTELSSGMRDLLRRAGKLVARGDFKGTLASFDTDLSLETDAGQASLNLAFRPGAGARRNVEGRLAAQQLRLGRLFANPGLGNAALTGRIEGTVGGGDSDLAVTGDITQLLYNGYDYDGMRLDGRLNNRRFFGRIASHNPGLQFDFFGLVDLNGEAPRYDFRVDLQHADLVALHFNRRDSVSVLSARIDARGMGRTLDDLNGRIHVSDALYRYDDNTLKLEELTVRGENSPTSKFVELTSDFADVTFRSGTSYRTVFEYMKMSAWKYLPILYDRSKYVDPFTAAEPVADRGYSMLSVDVKHVDPLLDAVAQGLQLADGSQLQLLFNPATDQLSLKASSNFVERDRLLATRLNVNATNRGDSLTMYLSAEDLYCGFLHLPDLSVMGGAKEGAMRLSTGFRDTLNRASGRLGLTARLVRGGEEQPRRIDVQLTPSQLTVGDVTWSIFARAIRIDTARVEVDGFYMKNDQQDLLVHGVASRSRDDSLTLHLRNFDLAPLSRIVSSMGYSIEGRTNGGATVKSALSGGEITADIGLDSVRVNGIAAPPMQLVSRWDMSRNRAGVYLTDRMRRDTLVRGYVAPSQGRYYARAVVDSLDMGLLNPVLKGVVSDTKGTADLDLLLQGRGREAQLTGGISVHDLSTRVDFTQVTYRLPKADLQVENNTLAVKGASMFDPQGREAKLDLSLSLQHLSNIAYDLRVRPRGMLVLDTGPGDNDVFYGRVYASGDVGIRGDKRGVKMNITATTDDNSSFTMPLSGKSNAAHADFVIFETAERPDTTDFLVRKKMLFERKMRRKSPSESDMDIDMTLNVRPNTDFRLVMTSAGDAISGRGEGTLNLHVNPKTNVFEMTGDYTIVEGKYQMSLLDIVRREFLIESGSSIQWTGEPLDALLDIRAVYKLKASLQPLLQGTLGSSVSERPVPVECIVSLGDRLTNPSMKFGVEVPNLDTESQTVVANALNTPETVDMQFFYLLVAGSFMSEGSATESAGGIGATASAATGLEFLTRQLTNLLSSDYYNVLFRYRPKSETASDELDFGLSTSLINNRLLVELEGNYLLDDKMAASSNMSNFMGEAYVTWLIDRAGTLRLRGFTQTIDRFDENQGLQETGIGIYWKEDFNNFRDFRRRVKERFANRKRRARREAARAAEAPDEESAAQSAPEEDAPDGLKE